MLVELDSLKVKANNMLIETDWLNMLVVRCENKFTLYKLIKYDSAAAYLDTRYCCFY
jgi:hypothetical protein